MLQLNVMIVTTRRIHRVTGFTAAHLETAIPAIKTMMSTKENLAQTASRAIQPMDGYHPRLTTLRQFSHSLERILTLRANLAIRAGGRERRLHVYLATRKMTSIKASLEQTARPVIRRVHGDLLLSTTPGRHSNSLARTSIPPVSLATPVDGRERRLLVLPVTGMPTVGNLAPAARPAIPPAPGARLAITARIVSP